MRASHRLLAALGSALILSASSSSANVIEGVGTYAKDRFHDTLDIFRLRAGFPDDGKAIGAKARLTSLAQVGYVHFDGVYAGMDRRGVGLVEERRREAGASVFYGSYNRMIAGFGNHFLKQDTEWAEVEDRRILRNSPHWDDGRQRHLSVGAEVATPLLALDLGVYPEEALDLALGILAIDIFNDDELLGYDTNVYRTPTTPAGPDLEGPFRARREANQKFKDDMELKAAMALVDAASKTTGDPTEAEGQLPPVNPDGEALITPEAADAAMTAVDEVPAADPAAPPPEADAPAPPIVLDPAPAPAEPADPWANPTPEEGADQKQEEGGEQSRDR